MSIPKSPASFVAPKAGDHDRGQPAEPGAVFNTMDPSPFHEKDLDHDLEEFIVSWATEYPLQEPIRLVVHVQNRPPGIDIQNVIERAVHNYFA